MGRREDRLGAVNYLYQLMLQGEEEQVVLAEYFQDKSENEVLSFYDTLLYQYHTHTADVIRILEENVKGWRLERLVKLDYAILKVATTEILYMEDIPVSVSINEAVEIAKEFSGEKGYKFINAVLRNVVNSLQK